LIPKNSANTRIFFAETLAPASQSATRLSCGLVKVCQFVANGTLRFYRISPLL
jgi:hypothetical protein